jgi:hemerythrin-like domain-containing protein
MPTRLCNDVPTSVAWIRQGARPVRAGLSAYLFPRFEKAGRLVELVTVLRTQHQRGRGLTGDVLQLGAAPPSASTEKQLRDALHLFIRMYRPHAARENTVLFPAFHELVTHKEYESLGEVFEEKEH